MHSASALSTPTLNLGEMEGYHLNLTPGQLGLKSLFSFSPGFSPGARKSLSHSHRALARVQEKSFSFSPGFSPVQEQRRHLETVSTVFEVSLRKTVKTVTQLAHGSTPG